MNQAELITVILAASPERYAAIVNAAKGEARRRPILPKAAAEILGVHRRTLQRYERAGLLHPIRLSTQKIRYDAGEVERLAERGMEAVTA